MALLTNFIGIGTFTEAFPDFPGVFCPNLLLGVSYLVASDLFQSDTEGTFCSVRDNWEAGRD